MLAGSPSDASVEISQTRLKAGFEKNAAMDDGRKRVLLIVASNLLRRAPEGWISARGLQQRNLWLRTRLNWPSPGSPEVRHQDRLRELTSIHQSNPFPNYALGISRASCCLCGSTFISQMMWKSCGKTEHRCRNAAAENELTLSQKVRIEIEVCTEKRH